MSKAILLRDLLQLMPTHTEIVMRDENYTLIFVGTKYDENIHKSLIYSNLSKYLNYHVVTMYALDGVLHVEVAKHVR